MPDLNAALAKFASSPSKPSPPADLNAALSSFATKKPTYGQQPVAGGGDLNAALKQFNSPRQFDARGMQFEMRDGELRSLTPEREKFLTQRPELLQESRPQFQAPSLPGLASLPKGRMVSGQEMAQQEGLTQMGYQPKGDTARLTSPGQLATNAMQRLRMPIIQALAHPGEGLASLTEAAGADDTLAGVATIARELTAPEGEGRIPTFREFAGLAPKAGYSQGYTMPAPGSQEEAAARERALMVMEMLDPADPLNLYLEVLTGGAGAGMKALSQVPRDIAAGPLDNLGAALMNNGGRRIAEDFGLMRRPLADAAPHPVTESTIGGVNVMTPAEAEAKAAAAEALARSQRTGTPKSLRQMQRELQDVDLNQALDEFNAEDARFSYEEDAPRQPLQSKTIQQMREEMRNPIPPPEPAASPKSASQLRAEMAKKDLNQALSDFTMNPDLQTAKPVDPELRTAARPQAELSRPALTLDEMDELRALPETEFDPTPSAPKDLNAALDDFAKRAAQPEPVVRESATVEPAIARSAPKVQQPELQPWQRPTPKNVQQWEKTIANHEAITEPKIRQAVAAGQDEAAMRAHYREMEPSSVKYARENLQRASEPHISPSVWEEKFAPSAVRVQSVGKTKNVHLTMEELSSWKFQTPAERRAAIEARALAAKPTRTDVPTYTAPPEVGGIEDDIAREFGVDIAPREDGAIGRELRAFRERKAAEAAKKGPSPDEAAKAADKQARLDEFNRRSLELVEENTPKPTGKGRLKPEPLASDAKGSFVDMGAKRYRLTEFEAKYYDKLPEGVDKAEWLKQRASEPRPKAPAPEGGAGRVGMDFEADAAPTGALAQGWDSPRAPEAVGNRKLTAEEKADWEFLTAAERKEMLGMGPKPKPETGGKVGMDFEAAQPELGYKVGGEQVKLGQAASVKELPVPAIVRFVKETTGSYPNVTEALRALGKKMGGVVKGRVVGRAIELNPDLLADVSKLAKVMAHEIGHLPDLMPWASKGINGGIGEIRKGMRSWLKSLPADVRKELWEASKHWRPIDESTASAKQLNYRKDVEETFADAISQMFNDPEGLAKRAPKFWKEFTAQLDKTPKLKQSIADVHAWRSGTLQDLTADLRQQIRGDMVRGEDLFKALADEAKQREQSLIYRLHQNWGAVETSFLDEGGVWKAWADRLERQGLTVPEHLDPRIHYDAYQFTDGPTAKVAQHANEKILQPLREAGVDEHLAGEWIKNQAIADGHRAGVANSRGVTAKEAQEALRQIEAQLSPEQLKAVKGAAEQSREMFVDALREAKDAGRLDAATFERLAKMKNLTPQLELEKLHKNLEEVVASIETGSFAEASNPLIDMLQQTLAIRGEARRNKARQVMLDFVKEFAPEEILAKPRKGTKQFNLYRNGVKESHHVDAYLEDLFQVTSTRELDGIAKGLDVATGAFQKVWLRWQPAFYAAQGVMDVFKSARNLAAVGLYNAWDPTNVARVLGSYKKAFGAALDYAREVPNDVISRMIDEQAILPADLSLTNQMAGDALGNAGQLDAILRQAGVNTQKALEQGNYFRKMAAKLGDFWTGLGRFSEALPKVAAYQELSKSTKISPAYRANIVRTKIGQPGNYVRGKFTRSSNRLLTFSNTIVQDMRSNWHLMRRPSTRGGFAVSMLKQSFIPKLLIGGAAAGWFGSELAEMMAAIPERDKRNSIPIPLGWEEGGEFGKRVHYINIPMDPTDKLFGSMFYEAMFGNEKEAQDRLATVGETVGSTIPGVNPTIGGLKNWTQALFGGDPQDGFGRDILSRDEAMAGVGARLGGTLRWQIGEFGMPGQALQGAIWNENLGQKTEWAPANIPFLTRFFKSSDAGFAERQRAGELAEDRGKARGRLAQGDSTRELRSQWNRLGGLGKKTPQQAKAYNDLRGWHALYEQQTQWIDMLDHQGKKAQADAARARLESYSQKAMARFQATTGKRWK